MVAGVETSAGSPNPPSRFRGAASPDNGFASPSTLLSEPDDGVAGISKVGIPGRADVGGSEGSELKSAVLNQAAKSSFD